MKRSLLLVALGSLAAAPLAAQSFHTVTSARQRSGEKEMRVNVEFAAGRFRLNRDASGALYRSRLSYNDERFRPLAHYSDGELRIGLKSIMMESNFNLKKHEFDRQALDLSLAPDVPMHLDLSFAAGEADVDLGGLNLAAAAIHTGASQSRVAFSSPTTGECENLSFEVGAAEFRAEQLGNARCADLEFLGGAGDLSLDFSGSWNGITTARADIKIGVGALKLTFPRNIGVEVEVSRILSSFDHTGFVKRGDTYYSSNWDSSKVRLHLDIVTALGSVEVAWH